MARKPSGASAGRTLALQVCADARIRQGYVRDILDAVLSTASLPNEEADYARLLVCGVTATRGTLDEVIDRNLNTPKDVKPKVRDALRISVFELLFLQKPGYAVVSQGVELVRFVAPKAAGLANAVLHKVLEDIEDFPWEGEGTDMEIAARSMGAPAWLYQRLAEELGADEVTGILSASCTAAPLYVNVDAPLESTEPFGVAGCLRIHQGMDDLRGVLSDPQVLVSDAAAQCVAYVAASFAEKATSHNLLEIGAGRGTKTLLMKRFTPDLAIDCVEIHQYRCDLMEKRFAEAGLEQVRILQGDGTAMDSLDLAAAGYACVFVDAPCSGLGTMRRHPERVWDVSGAQIDELAGLQYALLKEASKHVKAGGYLVYATCTVLSQENGSMIAAFLDSPEGSSFSPVSLEDEVPQDFKPWVTDEGYLQTYPEAGGPDGHFCAVLTRGGEEGSAR